MDLNKYRIMWIFVFFDLPTNKKKDRKSAAYFRKNLIKDGFNMMQYSVYMRHCPSRENAETHIRRVKSFLPPKGIVNILRVTDMQFGMMESYVGKVETGIPEVSYQLEFF